MYPAWLLLLLPVLAYAQYNEDEPQFIENTSGKHGVEYYDDEGIRYAIFLEQVAWHEAKNLCPANNGTLVVFKTEAMAEFIGRALAESAVGYTSLWVGGEYVLNPANDVEGEWKWISGDTISTDFEGVEEFPMKASPFWLDKPKVPADRPYCLATDRKMHHLPIIFPLPCDMMRPYICALPLPGAKEVPTEIKPPVKVGGKVFHLFVAHVTWSEALMQCRGLGLKLAVVTKEEEFRILGQRMLRSRPVMENAWISGSFNRGKWMWVSSNEPINVNQRVEVPGEPFAWYRPENIVMDGCLLADRHLCDHFVYVEAQCDRRRNYICEEDQKNTTLPPFLPVKPYPGWWMSTAEVNWFKAQNICRSCLEGSLVELNATREGIAHVLPILYSAMALTLRVEIRHVWIGGYLFHETFKWTNDSKTEPGVEKTINFHTFEALYMKGEKVIIEFCAVNFTQDKYLLKFKCLNLDRENQKNFLIYGIQCTAKQHFICKTRDIRHLWLGGYLFDEKFKWASETSPEPGDQREITSNMFDNLSDPSVNGVISFCGADYTKEKYLLNYKCLNLDRENQKAYFMYGLACDMKQHFICRTEGIKKMEDNCFVRTESQKVKKQKPPPKPKS